MTPGAIGAKTLFWRFIRLVSLAAAICVAATGAHAEDRAPGELTDEELETRVARWESLSVDDRRALLTEIHKRMVADGKKPVVRVRTERRYGYRIRRPDGSVVEVHKREGVVRYHRLDPDRPFGVGFERRSHGRPTDEPNASDKSLPLSAVPVPAADERPVFRLPLPARPPLERLRRAESEARDPASREGR